MGFGGNLMWTAVFREIWKQKKNPKLKIIPINNNNICRSEMWINNPYITYDINYKPQLLLNIGYSGHGTIIPGASTWQYDKYIDDSHIIYNRCLHYRISNPKIKCDLFFTKDEINKVTNYLKKLPEKFIIIEPHSKDAYKKNNYYPFNKWQNIRKSITKYPIVQVGKGGKRILDNVINMTGKLSFRETAYLISKCVFFLGTEGGLGHCCNAVNSPGLIIVPPMYHPNLIKYDNIQYIWLGTKEHSRCGMKVKCQKCHHIINNHNEKTIIKILMD